MKYLVFALTLMIFFGCGDSQAELDDITILEYIEANGLDAMKTSSGLYIVINDPGSAEKPISTSDVEVCYEGYRLNGDIFDTTYDLGVCSSATFKLSGLIQGWQEGFLLFGKGGMGKLIIPSPLAYGSTGAGSIPPNTPIVFDIHLLDF